MNTLPAAENCDCDVIHEDTVMKVRQEMPADQPLTELADLFKVFGDFTRVRILWALSEAEMCVCDIAFLLDMTQSAISHQLRVLKQSALVKSRRDGRIVFYSLNDEHVRMILDQGFEHVTEAGR